MKRVLFILLLLLSTAAYAQLDTSITKLRCGDGKLDKFELCDKGANESFCQAWGALLNIANACNEKLCTCVPKINPVYCGNNRRESSEMCDGTSTDDRCARLGDIMNLSLKCNQKTCGCAIDEALPSDYNPQVIDALKNESGKASVCGDRKVERSEECDPPNTLCTTNTKEPGVCTDKCKCVTAEMLDSEPVKESDKTASELNTSSDKNVSSEEAGSTNATQESKTVEEPERGFFGSILAWIVALFS